MDTLDRLINQIDQQTNQAFQQNSSAWVNQNQPQQ